MINQYPENWPQFFTATVYNWNPLLKEDKHKDIIMDCLKFLVDSRRVIINGFVIMSNHIHLIWQACSGYTLKKISARFAGYTANQFLNQLEKEMLKIYEVNAADRKHNFWKRDPLGIELFTPAVLNQKLDYIHFNPVRAGLCNFPEEYKYSSALFYEKGEDIFNLLTHYRG